MYDDYEDFLIEKTTKAPLWKICLDGCLRGIVIGIVMFCLYSLAGLCLFGVYSCTSK